MKGKRVTKINKKKPSNQRSAERKLTTPQAAEIFTSQVTKEGFSSENTRHAMERKRVSKNRVVASGFKPMTLNLDSAVMELLHDLYGGAGLKYTTRNGEICFKVAELSMMISYLITTHYNTTVTDQISGYKVYLHKIMAVVKFRKEFQFENEKEICDFLNVNKFKRYASVFRFKNGYDSTWEPKHLAMYIEAKSADEVYKKMKDRRIRLMKKVIN